MNRFQANSLSTVIRIICRLHFWVDIPLDVLLLSFFNNHNNLSPLLIGWIVIILHFIGFVSNLASESSRIIMPRFNYPNNVRRSLNQLLQVLLLEGFLPLYLNGPRSWRDFSQLSVTRQISVDSRCPSGESHSDDLSKASTKSLEAVLLGSTFDVFWTSFAHKLIVDTLAPSIILKFDWGNVAWIVGSPRCFLIQRWKMWTLWEFLRRHLSFANDSEESIWCWFPNDDACPSPLAEAPPSSARGRWQQRSLLKGEQWSINAHFVFSASVCVVHIRFDVDCNLRWHSLELVLWKEIRRNSNFNVVLKHFIR